MILMIVQFSSIIFQVARSDDAQIHKLSFKRKGDFPAINLSEKIDNSTPES